MKKKVAFCFALYVGLFASAQLWAGWFSGAPVVGRGFAAVAMAAPQVDKEIRCPSGFSVAWFGQTRNQDTERGVKEIGCVDRQGRVWFGAVNVSHVVNVKAYGAKGDGVTDDTVAIQLAIAVAKTAATPLQGGQVYFPCGQYIVTVPLLLPRTGSTPVNVVHLVGENVRCVRLGSTGTASFPANRALIEWEVVLAKAWHQRIENINFTVPNVTGAMAIHYEPTLQSTFAEINAERLQIDLRNVVIENSNQFHTRSIWLEGEVYASTLENVYCDPTQGTPAFDTICVETDTNLFGNALASGHLSGFFNAVLRNVQGVLRRGGHVQVFKGTMNRSTFDTSTSLGNRNAASFEFINSFESTLVNLSTEGLGEKGQYRFTNTQNMQCLGCGVAPGSDQGLGVGNGIELVSTTGLLWRGRSSSSGSPSFTSTGTKMVTVDANSHRNKFLGLHTTAAFSSEITDSGSDNYFEGYNHAATAKDFLGSLPQGRTLFLPVAFGSLGTPANGTVLYCSDCTIANPCAGAGTGAMAKRLNGAWVCN